MRARSMLHPPAPWLAGSLVLALAGPFAATPARATDACVAAGCVPFYVGSGVQACGFLATGYRCGQTFTPGFGGMLRELRIGLWSLDPHDAVVELHATVGGLPTGAPIAEATIPGSPYPASLMVADFSSQLVALEAGVKYAFTLRASGTQPVEALGSFSGCGGYSGTGNFVVSDDSGQNWSLYPYDQRSLVYQVCIDAATAARPASWGDLKIRYR